jgi:hypothetical protein
MNYLILGYILVIIIVGIVWSMWGLMTFAQKIHNKLDTLEEKTKAAKTSDELETLWNELKEVSKDCWHKTLSSRVVVIKTILETKYETLIKTNQYTTIPSFEFVVVYNGMEYKMPNCRFKVDANGGISPLIRDELGKWQSVKGSVKILNGIKK